jgi:hypothetical protein
MRSTLLTICAMAFNLWLLVCGAVPAHAQSGTELLRYCTALERGVRSGPSGSVALPSNYDAFVCWGFMSAMQEMSALSNDGSSTLTGTCGHPDTTTMQHVYIFNNYARNHPAQLHNSAAEVALLALREAFPCTGNRPWGRE